MKTQQQFEKKAHTELSKSYPNLTQSKRQVIIDRYINAVINEINSKFNQFVSNSNSYYVSLDAISKKTYGYPTPNKQVRMLKWFNNHCPLYKIVNLGSNISKTYTEIQMYYEHKILVDFYYQDVIAGNEVSDKEIAIDLYGKELWTQIKTLADDEVDVVPVDLKSLKAYIDKTSSYKKTDSITDRIRKAKRIYLLAWIFDGQLIQVKSDSDFGRHFYKGPNLQNAHKDIRHAALGDCYEYDINNSVYAWRVNEAKFIQPDIKLPLTLEYLEFKKTLRKRLALLLTNTKASDEFKEGLIKEAFTAMSFGGKGVAKPLKIDGKTQLAINGIIKQKDDRKAFLEDEFVDAFRKEQELITKIIFEYWKPHLKGEKLIYCDNIDRISKPKAMAYLYQQVETATMDSVLSNLGSNLLLRCHDAFYVRYVDADKISMIRHDLSALNNYIKLSKTKIDKYRPPLNLTMEQEHKLHMEKEYKASIGYESRYVTETKPVISMEEYLEERIANEKVKKQESGLSIDDFLKQRGIKC